MKRIAISISLLFFIIGLFVLPHYGINWDEPLHFSRGQAILHYFLAGKKDYKDLSPYKKYTQKDDTILFEPVDVKKSEVVSRSAYQDNQQNYTYFLKDYGHPPLSDIFSSAFNIVLFQKFRLVNDIDSYHVYSLFLAAILIGIVFWWISKYYGKLAGLIASLSLSLYPLFLGESHFNIKDVPETVFYSLTLISFYEGFVKKKVLCILLSSMFLAFAFATKFNALFIPFTVIPWSLIYLFTNKKIKQYLKFSLWFIFFPVLAFSVLYLTWPFLWKAPIERFLDVVGYYKGIGINIGFDMRYLTYFKINSYALQWILFSTPLVTLLLAFFGVTYFFTKGIREKKKLSLLIFIWFIFPIARVSAPNAGIYGGVRHIMEFVPAMAMLAGIGGSYLVTLLEDFVIKKIKRNDQCKAKSLLFLQIGIVFLFIPVLIKLISIHPNEGVYFNFLYGGLNGAKEQKIPEWGQNLGSVHKQGLVWLNKNAENNARMATNFGLGSSISNLFLRKDINFSNAYRSVLERKGEYVLGLTHDTGFEYTYFFKYLDKFLNPVYEVKVDGVPILRIWKNDIKHTKKEYKNIVLITDAPSVDANKDTVVLDVGKVVVLAKMTIKFGGNCDREQEGEGSVSLSINSKDWFRLDGDLRAQSFLPMTTYGEDNGFVYYFAADSTRYIRLNLAKYNSCFKQIKAIKIYGVKD